MPGGESAKTAVSVSVSHSKKLSQFIFSLKDSMEPLILFHSGYSKTMPFAVNRDSISVLERSLTLSVQIVFNMTMAVSGLSLRKNTHPRQT